MCFLLGVHDLWAFFKRMHFPIKKMIIFIMVVQRLLLFPLLAEFAALFRYNFLSHCCFPETISSCNSLVCLLISNWWTLLIFFSPETTYVICITFINVPKINRKEVFRWNEVGKETCKVVMGLFFCTNSCSQISVLAKQWNVTLGLLQELLFLIIVKISPMQSLYPSCNNSMR